MTAVRIWFARIMGVYALVLFSFLAYLYVWQPTAHIAKFGVSVTGSPESINFLRAGPGALFFGLAVVAGIGLVRPRRLRHALFVLVLFTGVVVLVRLYGMAADGITPVQVSELRDEGVSWLCFLAALLLHPPATSRDEPNRPHA